LVAGVSVAGKNGAAGLTYPLTGSPDQIGPIVQGESTGQRKYAAKTEANFCVGFLGVLVRPLVKDAGSSAALGLRCASDRSTENVEYEPYNQR
jgi:hypothetical protein